MSISKSFSLLRQRNKASYQAQLHSESTVVLPKLIWQTCFLLVLFQKYITIESSFCVISFSRNGCAIGGRLDLVWIISIFSITTAIWYFAAIFFSDATVAQYTHHTLQWRHFHLHSDHYAADKYNKWETMRDLKQETYSVVGTLVFRSSWNFALSWVEHEKTF